MTDSPTPRCHNNLTTTKPPVGWTRCHAYLEKKNRFCRQQPLPPFPGSHSTLTGPILGDLDRSGKRPRLWPSSGKDVIQSDSLKESPNHDESGSSRTCLDEASSVDHYSPVYCGNHQHLAQIIGRSQNKDSFNESESGRMSPLRTHQRVVRKRIPCPLDPSHLIYADAVQRHVQVCPRARIQHEQQQQPYFCHGINSGGHGDCQDETDDDGVLESTDSHPHDSETTLRWAQQVAMAVLRAYQYAFPTETNIDDATCSVNQHSDLARTDASLLSFDAMYGAIPELDLAASELDDNHGLPAAIRQYRIKSGGMKHMYQQASLIGHLKRINHIQKCNAAESECGRAPDATNHLILEMGAGRGMLGIIAAGVFASASSAPVGNCGPTIAADTEDLLPDSSTHLVMIERTGTRAKADTVLRQAQNRKSSIFPAEAAKASPYMDLQRIQWTRVPCDLAHVDVSSIVKSKLNEMATGKHSVNKRTQVTVVAKHLCGCGTDLALKSLVAIRDRIDVCVMATCCHGVCNWHDYVGRAYLSQVMIQPSYNNGKCDHEVLNGLSGFGQSEFELMRLWSCGTVLDQGNVIADSDLKPRDCIANLTNRNTCEEHDSLEHDTNKESSAIKTSSAKAIVDSIPLACGVHGLGRACQRLIDYGRLKYLRDVIFADSTSPKTTEQQLVEGDGSTSIQLIHYVPARVTPQNAALVSFRSR